MNRKPYRENRYDVSIIYMHGDALSFSFILPVTAYKRTLHIKGGKPNVEKM